MVSAFHLCQPKGRASCGACCGLYNFRDYSRDRLRRVLERRTEALREAPRTPQAFSAIARELRQTEEPPLFSTGRVCPLLGFVDEGSERVGCLAHPAVTGGVDLRDCGAYKSETCQQFLCPSFQWLSDEEAELVRRACDDWYLYGLVITDVDFIRGCLRLVETELAGPVSLPRVLSSPEALERIRHLFELKESAPLRDNAAAVFGRFEPDDDAGARLRILDYDALGRRAAPEDDLVLCLGYAPASAEVLDVARSEVHRRVAAVAQALTAAQEPPAG